MLVAVSPLVAPVMGKGAAKACSRAEPREPDVVARDRASFVRTSEIRFLRNVACVANTAFEK